MSEKIEYEYILFDLDGTVTDPKVGITKSVAFALDAFGYHVSNYDTLTKFIGPPLLQSFMEFYSFTEEEAKEAIRIYREYFKVTGLFENELYQGMRELLAMLVQNGKKLILATSKPTVFATQILDHFRLTRYFTMVTGSELDGTRSEKEEVIAYALSKAKISDLSKVVMVGDRKFDVMGAKENQIASIAVSYGYGSQQELEDCKPDYIVTTIEELGTLLG